MKKGLGLLLIECIESGVDRVCYSEYLWKFLDITLLFMETCVSNLVSFLSNDHISIQEKIERRNWIELCLLIISAVFHDFNLANFRELNYQIQSVLQLLKT